MKALTTDKKHLTQLQNYAARGVIGARADEIRTAINAAHMNPKTGECLVKISDEAQWILEVTAWTANVPFKMWDVTLKGGREILIPVESKPPLK